MPCTYMPPTWQLGKQEHTWRSMASIIGFGPDAKPIRMPAERILEKLSKRITRPSSGVSSSSLKYEGGRSSFPKYR